MAHHFSGLLVAGLSSRLKLDESYRDFLDLLSSQIATAIATAQAYEEERKRAEALAEIDRAKTAFFSNVSHEFRTPLTLMLGPLESLLAADAALAPEYRDEVATAHRNSLRLLKLVNSLLDFSRIEAGRVKASFAPTDLPSLTADLASNFRSAMDAAGLELVVDCRPLPQPVYIDRDMWEKIVLNLLSNAFKFTFEGRVTVRLECDGDRALLTVSDTGTGIPEAELPRIFERFHRVEGARGRTDEGTGIGLALIQELVKLHGGAVQVSSRVGKGSVFEVSIPFGRAHLPKEQVVAAVAAAAGATAVRSDAYTSEALTWVARDRLLHATEDVPDLKREAGPRPRILLADDNADMRDHVARILGDRYDLVAVADGAAALAEAARLRPDLVLSDVMMPKLDGFGLLQALRADPQMVNVPFIMLSARAGEEARSEGMESGADDYLVKPFSARELLARMSAHLKLAVYRKEANEQSARLLESITDAFIALDPAWRFTYVNAEAERLTGLTHQEMRGRKYWDLFPDAIRTTLDHELSRVMRERLPAEFEYHYASSDRWFHVKAQPASDGGVSIFSRDITARKRAEDERDALMERERLAHEEAEALNQVARALGSELDLQRVVQIVTDTATRLTHAKFGAFFYNVLNEDGESYMLYTLSGASREVFEKFGMMPRNTPVFRTTFGGLGARRSDDIRKDPDYGKMQPHFGMPKGHLPVCSYLAVPVKSRSGEVLGGLFFGHPEPGVFTESAERLATGIAAHAAIAIDNARLFQRAEQQARESLLLASIVDSSDDAIISKDLDGVITSWNKSAERVFGYTAEEAIGRTVAALLIPEDRQHEEPDILRRLRNGERVDHFETIRRRRDGTLLNVSLTISPMKDRQGQIIGASKICRDITQQVSSRESIGRLNEQLTRDLTAMTRLQQLSASAAQPGELTGLLDQVMDAAIEIVGADMGNIQLYRNGRLRIVCQRGFRPAFLDFFDSVEQGEAACGTALQRGERVVVPDVLESAIFAGTPSLEVMLQADARSVQSTPLQSRSGAVLGMLSTHYHEPHQPTDRDFRLLDLLARQAADLIEGNLSAEALRNSERQFRQLAEVGPQIVWLSGPNGELEFVNQRWIEFSGLDFEATRDAELIATRLHPDDHLLDHWQRCVETGTPFELEARLRGKNEVFRWFLMRSAPLRDEEGRILRWYGTSTDIHESKLLQLELKRANQDLEQFAYSASHDLQEPLRGVKIFSQLLHSRYGDKLDGQALEFLGNVRESATRMEMLVRDLLAYTQASTDDKDPEDVDANAAMQAAIGNLAGAIAEIGATVDFDALPSVRIGAIPLQQVFQNLISNAIKYHRPGIPPVVHTTARRERSSWLFSVRDNGIGIPPEFQERIFGLFKRLHTGDEYSGTGIGLALCKRIIERHSGRIWVESEPGVGSSFHFTLPAE